MSIIKLYSKNCNAVVVVVVAVEVVVVVKCKVVSRNKEIVNSYYNIGSIWLTKRRRCRPPLDC